MTHRRDCLHDDLHPLSLCLQADSVPRSNTSPARDSGPPRGAQISTALTVSTAATKPLSLLHFSCSGF